MASTALDLPPAADVRSIQSSEKHEKKSVDEIPVAYGMDDEARPSSSNHDESVKPLIDSTHRKLKPRHIQLIGIGGFVAILLLPPRPWRIFFL